MSKDAQYLIKLYEKQTGLVACHYHTYDNGEIYVVWHDDFVKWLISQIEKDSNDGK